MTASSFYFEKIYMYSFLNEDDQFNFFGIFLCTEANSCLCSFCYQDGTAEPDPLILIGCGWREYLSANWIAVECDNIEILRALNPGAAAFAWAGHRYRMELIAWVFFS